MKKFFFVLLLSCLFYSVNVTGTRAEDPDAALLIKEIKTKGAKEALGELTADCDWNKFIKVCDKIATGKKEWLEVAKQLLLGSDAGATESLESSVARALPNAPRQVLELIAETRNNTERKFTIDTTCTSPFIEPEHGVEEKYLLDSERTLKLLDTSDNQKLNRLRIQCLGSIQKDITYLKKHGLWHPRKAAKY